MHFTFGDLELHPLFPVPIARQQIPKIDPVVKDFLMNYKEVVLRPESQRAGHILKVLDEPICKDLKQDITNRIHDYVYNCLGVSKSVEFRMTNSWVSKQDPGQPVWMHSHATSILSGVLYLQADDNAGRIIFHRRKHFDNLFSETIHIPVDFPNLVTSSGIPFEVKENDLLLFPSNLEHSVEENQSSRSRYSLAFNFFVYGSFGYDNVTQLEIK